MPAHQFLHKIYFAVRRSLQFQFEFFMPAHQFMHEKQFSTSSSPSCCRASSCTRYTSRSPQFGSSSRKHLGIPMLVVHHASAPVPSNSVPPQFWFEFLIMPSRQLPREKQFEFLSKIQLIFMMLARTSSSGAFPPIPILFLHACAPPPARDSPNSSSLSSCWRASSCTRYPSRSPRFKSFIMLAHHLQLEIQSAFPPIRVVHHDSVPIPAIHGSLQFAFSSDSILAPPFLSEVHFAFPSNSHNSFILAHQLQLEIHF